MQVKNEYDRQGLLAIGRVVAEILDDLCRYAEPGLTTADLDRRAAELLLERGAESTPAKEYGFPGKLCISVNDEVVHGIPGDRVLRGGDLIKLDLTADKRGFVADATRMVILPGGAGGEAALLAASARRACLAAIAGARPGVSLTELGGIVQQSVRVDGFKVVRELCGHGVGRRTHEEPEVPNFPDRSNAVVLRQGMVITIEPIISAGNGSIRSLDDGWTVATGDGAWSAHYEETVIVGENGAEIATAAGDKE